MNDNRRIRVFVSSTFRDMMGERDELTTHAWPELRRFCRERQVELVEVDLRWGIAEEQSTRKETLKLCLDEIRACRPFFIGLLGERYGWTPGGDAFTADLKEEQPWLNDLHGKSVTELEILHGVLNNPEIAGRAYFYFRDPKFIELVSADKKTDFTAEDAESAKKQTQLKTLIRQTCAAKKIPLHENYPDPVKLAALVLEDLKAAIEAQSPIESIPDPLTREARDHKAFAETRRRTYIGRPDYFEALDRHAAGDVTPLVLLGDSGSGKSALLANWLAHWHTAHPKDFIFQHYIGGTPDSADHWRLMTRLIAEIKRWTDDPEEMPKSHDDLLKNFPVWLAKARIKAERDGMRCLLVLDALNQLDECDHARTLGWLPEHSFSGPLRLVVSTLPGDTLEAVTSRGWRSLRVKSLTPDERCRMIEHYLARFGKKLDVSRLERIAATPAVSSPLYLKILLDELRVTGTHDRLDERLSDYLAATDIPSLLEKVLARYQHDYERGRKGLVSDALGLIWAARRGLTEAELLRLLKPTNLPQLPLAIWTPLRATLEESLVDHSGILNFAHDSMRTAVEAAFVTDQNTCDELRLRLADDFQRQPISTRSCDELPWLLWKSNQGNFLRVCLLDIARFILILVRDQNELLRYWVWLKGQRTMGSAYVDSFETWFRSSVQEKATTSFAASQLAQFLSAAALHTTAEVLMRRALAIDEQIFGPEHPTVGISLNNLAVLLQDTHRLAEAEPLLRRGLAIAEQCFGSEHPTFATNLINLAQLLQASNRLAEAEPLLRRALAIGEKSFGPEHPEVAKILNNLAGLMQVNNQLVQAEPLLRRALAIAQQCLGADHPNAAIYLNNLAVLLYETNRHEEAEPFLRQGLAIDEQNFGPEHPNVAVRLNNLTALLQVTNRLAEAEPLIRRAMKINEQSFGLEHHSVATNLNNLAQLLQSKNMMRDAEPLYLRAFKITEKSFGPNHPRVAICLACVAHLMHATNRSTEAEPLLRRALAIDEQTFGSEHPNIANDLFNLAQILQATNRLAEAEQLMQKALEILLMFTVTTGHHHPNLQDVIGGYAGLLSQMGRSEPEVWAQLNAIAKPYSI